MKRCAGLTKIAMIVVIIIIPLIAMTAMLISLQSAIETKKNEVATEVRTRNYKYCSEMPLALMWEDVQQEMRKQQELRSVSPVPVERIWRFEKTDQDGQQFIFRSYDNGFTWYALDPESFRRQRVVIIGLAEDVCPRFPDYYNEHYPAEVTSDDFDELESEDSTNSLMPRSIRKLTDPADPFTILDF